MGIFQEFPYIKNLVVWMFIPVVLVCVILGFIALRSYNKNKHNLTFNKKRSIKLILNLIGILLLAAIFIFMLAVINIFIEKTEAYDLEFTNKLAYYIIIISPIVPFMFMFTFIVNFFKTLKSKEKKLEIDKNEKFDIGDIQKFEIDDKKNEEELPPVESYSAKTNQQEEKDNTEEIEELEVI